MARHDELVAYFDKVGYLSFVAVLKRGLHVKALKSTYENGCNFAAIKAKAPGTQLSIEVDGRMFQMKMFLFGDVGRLRTSSDWYDKHAEADKIDQLVRDTMAEALNMAAGIVKQQMVVNHFQSSNFTTATKLPGPFSEDQLGSTHRFWEATVADGVHLWCGYSIVTMEVEKMSGLEIPDLTKLNEVPSEQEDVFEFI